MNDISWTAIGLVVTAALLAGVSLMEKAPNDDVAFLERLASRTERLPRVAPETRHYFSELMGRHESPLADARLDARRQKALTRINAVLRPAGAPETVASSSDEDFPVLTPVLAPQ